MKKPRNRILSTLLALAVVLALLPASRLSASAADTPKIEVSPIVFFIALKGQTDACGFVISSTGSAPLTGIQIALSGPDAADFTQANPDLTATSLDAAGGAQTETEAYLRNNAGLEPGVYYLTVTVSADGAESVVQNTTLTVLDIIDSVKILGAAAPKAGEHPLFSLSAPQEHASEYSVVADSVVWHDVTDNKDLVSTDTFENGHLYTLTVDISAALGYGFSFADHSDVVLDGVSGYGVKVNDYKTNDTISFTFTAPIEQIVLNGITAPAAGAAVTDPSAGVPAEYGVSSIEAFDNVSGKVLKAGDTYRNGEDYTLRMIVTAKEGWSFTDLKNVTASFPGLSGSYFTTIVKHTDDSDCLITISVPQMIRGINTEIPYTGDGNHAGVPTVGGFNGYSIQSYVWYNVTDGKDMTSADVFESGKIYTLTVVYAADPGYLFAPKSELNTYSLLGTHSVVSAGSVCTVVYQRGNEITNVPIDGAAAPKAGEHPSFSLSAPQEHASEYSVAADGVVWHDVTDNKDLAPTDTFEDGHLYTLSVRLSPGTEYSFPLYYAGIDASLTGVNAVQSNMKNQGADLIVTFAFTEPLTNAVLLGAKAPAAGQKPVDSLQTPAGSHYSVGEINWYDLTSDLWLDDSSVFAGDHNYFVMVSVNPEEGYAFDRSSPVSCSLDGLDFLANSIWVDASGPLSANFPFLEPVAGGTISGVIVPKKGEEPDNREIRTGNPGQVELLAAGWYNVTDDTEMSDIDVFEAGKIYRLEITLSSGYPRALADAKTFSVTLDGVDPALIAKTEVSNSGAERVLSYTFQALPKPEPDPVSSSVSSAAVSSAAVSSAAVSSAAVSSAAVSSAAVSSAAASSAASGSETALPRTGDNLDPLLWLSLMAAAALCLAAVLLWNRSRKTKQ